VKREPREKKTFRRNREFIASVSYLGVRKVAIFRSIREGLLVPELGPKWLARTKEIKGKKFEKIERFALDLIRYEAKVFSLAILT